MSNRGRYTNLLLFTGYCLLIAVLSGCGYTTKSLLPTHIKTVYVENFKNSIDIAAEVSSKKPFRLYSPGLENELTNAVAERFIFDGNLKVAKNPDEADSILSGELLEYIKEPLRYDDNENVTEFRVRVSASAKFLDKSANKIIWQLSNFCGESSQRTSGSLQKSEAQARSEAVDDLARRIVEKTTEVW
ncbi:MAG: LptE family protein [Candidatus Omnitrophica bacterium]|nr:LptE family protein [Candidatus Omnitrophota bacterium]